MPYCGSASLVKHYITSKSARVLKCRSWSCPDCQPDRHKRLVREGRGGNPNTFLTLTIRANQGDDPTRNAQRLIDAWRLCRLRLMRHRKMKHFPFLAVVEAHKSGQPHLHILGRFPYIPQAEISEIMVELIDSPHVDIRRINNPSMVAGYVAKYVGKQPHQFGTCKRYWKSRDYEQDQRWRSRRRIPDGAFYTRTPSPLWRLEIFWKENGWLVGYTKKGNLVARIRLRKKAGANQQAPPP
jgi:hypothetical protein